jgi:RNase P protein component
MREAFRLAKAKLPAIDLVVMPVQAIQCFNDVQIEFATLACKVAERLKLNQP